MEFKVGEMVMVRRWEAMEEEFGLNDYGHIDTP